MSTQAIELQTDSLSVNQVAKQQKQIWDLMATTMQKGEDYGTTPGSKKPSLYKSGSEKILAMFRLSVDVLVEEITPTQDIGPFDEYRVRVYVTVKEMGSGRFIGKGLGECSSWEEKYKWRQASGKMEVEYHEKLSPDFVRMKFKAEWKDGRTTGKEFAEAQVRVPTADRMNTVLKMAKKRAQIDATLTATAASAIFTQDVEDMPENLRATAAEDENQEQVERKSPGRKSEAANKTENKAQDADCISEAQNRMLHAISNKCGLSEEARKAKLKAEFKNKAGEPLEHSDQMLKKDFQRYIDAVDSDFKFHDQKK